MATDGPDPTLCDPEVFKNGTQVFITDSIPSNAMERWVQKVAATSGQSLDWHFVGGRARVLALGDLERVSEALAYLMPEHDELRELALEKI